MSYQEYSNELPRFLTQKQAERRGQQFVQETIDYKLQLRLNSGDSYTGIVEVSFNLVNANRDIFIDYQGANIERVQINKVDIGKMGNGYLNQLWNGLFFNLPSQYLNNGRNVVTMVFSNRYSKDGCGLHSFTDTDEKQYLYSQCEPYWASRIFPCFDQPDLKATLEARVVAPKSWAILSNELKSQEDKDFNLEDYQKQNPTYPLSSCIFGDIPKQNDYHYSSFRRTQLYPTYLFAFAVGPYEEIKCENTYNNIPMSLYSRSSLIPYLKNMSDWMFACTIEAMKLYEEFFGYPYPNYKYDQVFIPENFLYAMGKIK